MAIKNTNLGKGISLSSAFDLQTDLPLDSRAVVPNASGLQALIDNNAVYAGMIVYQEDVKKNFQFKENKWEELSLTNAVWENIQNTPTTLSGYGITDAYTKDEINNKFENFNPEVGGTVYVENGILHLS